MNLKIIRFKLIKSLKYSKQFTKRTWIVSYLWKFLTYFFLIIKVSFFFRWCFCSRFFMDLYIRQAKFCFLMIFLELALYESMNILECNPLLFSLPLRAFLYYEYLKKFRAFYFFQETHRIVFLNFYGELKYLYPLT